MSLFPGAKHLSPIADDIPEQQRTPRHSRTQSSQPAASEECASTHYALQHVTIEFQRYCKHEVHINGLTLAGATFSARIIIDISESDGDVTR
jgi:hypothetical protein